jgi:hypothetical protein
MRSSLLLLGACSIQLGCTEYEFKAKDRNEDGGDLIDELIVSPEWQVDSWESHSYTGTDIVFFGDTSGSMATELETMGEHALTFMDRLDDYGNSWQIIVVTGWDGCGVNGILTASVSSYDTLFAEALLTPPEQAAIDASADEWGLYDVDMAIQESGPGGCNEGFLREEALLHVIFLSDEDDNSPGWDGGDEFYWQSYVDSVLAAKSAEHLVTFSAVAGPVPDGCDGAEPGTGYTDAVDYTEGTLLSICDEWYNQLDTLVDASVQVSDFPLNNTPIVNTIRVVVDDTERTTGWEYQASGNLVHFLEDSPTTGEEVFIAYEVVE